MSDRLGFRVQERAIGEAGSGLTASPYDRIFFGNTAYVASSLFFEMVKQTPLTGNAVVLARRAVELAEAFEAAALEQGLAMKLPDQAAMNAEADELEAAVRAKLRSPWHDAAQACGWPLSPWIGHMVDAAMINGLGPKKVKKA